MKLASVRNGSSLIITPQGRIDAGNVQDFEEQLMKALDGVTVLVADLAAVEYISSAGLRLLLSVQKQLEADGGSLTLLQVQPSVREILDLVGLTDYLNIL